VTTPGELRYVGRLTAIFDNRGNLVGIDHEDSSLVRVSGIASDPDFAAEDPFIVANVYTPLREFIADLEANIIGTTEVFLDGRNPDPIRTRESNLGNLVADAFRATGNADVAITNGGGIRASIPAGPVSEADTFDVLPFDNLIVTVPDVPRQQFRALIEHGYSRVFPDERSRGRFAHISGLSVEIDRAAPVGQRVINATLDGGTPLVVNGVTQPGPTLDVATTDFLARGGDDYPFAGRPFVSTQVAYQRALFEFIVGELGGQVTAADYPVVGVANEQRIKQTPALPAPPPIP
jgi:2',3'-cyclic-nucleotide 2'-phosphodiesterase (5'-nucleotidase family)